MMSAPEKIENVAGESLRLTWADGSERTLPFRYLRQNCPCALCKDEWTGKRLLDPASVPADLKAERADVVGHYALQFLFSDGHSAGVFTFELLKKLPEPGGSE